MLRYEPVPPGVGEFAVVGRASRERPQGPLTRRERVRLEQVHGAGVVPVTAPGYYAGVDGAVTRTEGLVLSLRVADCLPVLLASPTEGVALVHAGWRGLLAGILETALAAFSRPEELSVLLGPGIGPGCFQVGPEVAARFPAETVHGRPGGRPHVDLAAAARLRLVAGGVPRERIAEPGPCTRCHQHLLHSHRGSAGEPGRNLAYAVVGSARPPTRPGS